MDRLFNVALPRVRDFRGIYRRCVRRPRQLLPRHEASRSSSPRSSTTRSRSSAAWTSAVCHHRQHRRRGPRAAHAAWALRSRTTKEEKKLWRRLSMKLKQAASGQVLHPTLQPLQDLRPSPRLPAQLRHLPYLLPRAGLQGRDPRREESQLVNCKLLRQAPEIR